MTPGAVVFRLAEDILAFLPRDAMPGDVGEVAVGIAFGVPEDEEFQAGVSGLSLGPSCFCRCCSGLLALRRSRTTCTSVRTVANQEHG
jgi:hypothetical protein